MTAQEHSTDRRGPEPLVREPFRDRGSNDPPSDSVEAELLVDNPVTAELVNASGSVPGTWSPEQKEVPPPIARLVEPLVDSTDAGADSAEGPESDLAIPAMVVTEPSSVPLDPGSTAAAAIPEPETDSGKSSRGPIRRTFSWFGRCAGGIFCLVSLVVLLATLTAIPIVQLIAFGYLLNVAGGLATGGTLRKCLPHFREAGQIGLAALAIIIAALPTQLLVHWESVAYLIHPESGQATMMRFLAIGTSALATVYLLWAWVRGGRLKHYLWPQPIRFVKEAWRWSTWKTAPDRLWDFTVSLELPKYFWLGLRGLLGTLVWLIPAMVLIVAFRNREPGLAGLIGAISFILLGIGMLYLPMLQAHFAAENRFRALFEVRTIRRDFRRAPWAWLSAMVLTLVLTPIPLYLLKIEATPREVMWLPCLLFIAFMLPARIATGLALRRARRASEPSGFWRGVSRWMVRLMMPAVVGLYLVFVYVSQYTSWDGLLTWVQQHAILIPVPFLSGT